MLRSTREKKGKFEHAYLIRCSRYGDGIENSSEKVW